MEVLGLRISTHLLGGHSSIHDVELLVKNDACKSGVITQL